MANCLIVQHVEPEPSWAIGVALARAGVTTDVCAMFAGDALPSDLSGFGGFVVMGGPMSACSDQSFPSRGAEVALLRDALERGLPTLGVCLGAQLLALAAGGLVRTGGEGPEVGWSEVELLPACEDDALFAGSPSCVPVLHWHSDTFELPAAAERLARSGRYANQAFRVGQAAWGLQFHLEVTPRAVEGFLQAFPTDAALAPGGARALREATAASLQALVPWRDQVFDRFTALVACWDASFVPGRSPHGFADISDS
jgi:GMP synthase-like glutamine amidotransferase